MSFKFSEKLARNKSGYFFFLRLVNQLKKSRNFDIRSRTVLVNVSIPIYDLLKIKMSGSKAIIRLDGAYHDSISHLDSLNNKFFKILGRYFPNSFMLNYLFNLLFENWKVEVRLFLSHAIVFQTYFSKKSHKYFIFVKNKKTKVITNSYVDTFSKNNGNKVLIVLGNHKRKNDKQALNLAIRYCKIKGMSLKIVGSAENDSELAKLLMTLVDNKAVELIEKYNNLDEFENITNDCKYFVFLSFRDPCPNILLETISFGLLPITIASGGIPEMLPENYPLITIEDNYGFFSPARYSERLPRISFNHFESVFDKVRLLDRREAHKEELTLTNVAEKYKEFLIKVDGDGK